MKVYTVLGTAQLQLVFLLLLSTFLCSGFTRVLKFCKEFEVKRKKLSLNANELFVLISRITDNTISGKIAKDVFKLMWEGNGSVDEIIEKQGLKQMTDSSALELIIEDIISNNLDQVKQFRDGNSKLLGFFVGQVMKATQGKANPKQVNQILNEKLS